MNNVFYDLVPVLEFRPSVGDLLYMPNKTYVQVGYHHLKSMKREPEQWLDVWIVVKIKIESKK